MAESAADLAAADQDTRSLPLVVDLDGTLTLTDTLFESVVQLAKRCPLSLFKLPVWLLRGRAHLKAEIAARVTLCVDALPIRHALHDYLLAERAKGRRLVLATAAHESIARGVAEKLGIFDVVLASDAGRNLKGETKLLAIRLAVGERFVYAGDSRADLPIWRHAAAAVLVDVRPDIADQVMATTPVERQFLVRATPWSTWLRALRVHQWAKNLLLFVPLLTGFAFLDAGKLAGIGLAFLAFSLAASATYMVNDLWDLESDRAHPRKRMRPFASGAIPIGAGIGIAAIALLSALALACLVSPGFVAMLALYVVLTSVYSWVLKRYVLIDVLMLSLLYTLRILAGSVAVDMPTSSWLLAFSVFLFFSLAIVKRCSELVSLQQTGRTAAHGRDYRVSDLTVLWPLGIAASLSAVVIFGLFISAPETQARYASGQLLWLVAVGLLYWVARLWIKTCRGEMHDDPLVFALRDRGSTISIGVMLTVTMSAYFLTIG